MQENPFNPDTQSKEFQFFKQMTDAINDWMLKKYPLFDDKLETKIKYLTEMRREGESYFDDREKRLQHLENHFINNAKIEINEFISKEHPGMSNKISSMTTDCETLFKSLQKQENLMKNYEKKIEKKLKELTKSSSVYQDIYTLRDEFNGFRSTFAIFKGKLQDLFK